uniref:Variant surface glycoprotein 1125.533 n=1 Tax=Trypanosoma brucei TaxID=5691 RepID=A0A1J0R4C9_9TRYP|nr:variant surface glycoprotein 1125.533 [Trypanosoma brucei]
MHTLWPVALLTGYFLAIAAANNSNKIAHDSTQWCHDIQYLEAALTAIDNELSKRQKQIQTDTELEGKWKMAEAAAEQWHEQRKYAALSIIITAIAHQNAAAAEAYRTAAAEASKVIRRRLNALDVAARATTLLKPKMQGSPSAAETNTQCIGPTAYDTETDPTCDQPPTGKLQTEGVATKLHTASVIKLTPFATINDLIKAPSITITVSDSSKSTFSSPGGTAGTCNTAVGQLTGGTEHLKYGLTAPAKATTTSPKEQNIDAATEKPEEPQSKQKQLSAWLDIKFVTHGLKNLKAAYNKKQINLRQADHATLATLTSFKTVIENLFSGGEPPADKKDTEYNNKIADIIKQTYGPEAGDFKTKFVTELANQDVKYTKAGNEQEKKLGALSKDSDLSIALSFMINKRHESQLQKAAKAVSTVPKQNCTGKTKEKCKDACEWKGTDDKGECKPKDEEGQTNAAGTQGAETEGKDDKNNTNTTGSNSFVIHKAPLLLAVYTSIIKFMKCFLRNFIIF